MSSGKKTCRRCVRGVSRFSSSPGSSVLALPLPAHRCGTRPPLASTARGSEAAFEPEFTIVVSHGRCLCGAREISSDRARRLDAVAGARHRTNCRSRLRGDRPARRDVRRAGAVSRVAIRRCSRRVSHSGAGSGIPVALCARSARSCDCQQDAGAGGRRQRFVPRRSRPPVRIVIIAIVQHGTIDT